jgi:hypothetical protein
MGEEMKPESYEAAVLRMGRVGGFAPGGYVSRCFVCERLFDGDKRATHCLPCAVAALAPSSQSPSVGEGALRAFAIYEVEEDADHLYLSCNGISATVPKVGQPAAVLRQIEAVQAEALSASPSVGRGEEDSSLRASPSAPGSGGNQETREGEPSNAGGRS